MNNLYGFLKTLIFTQLFSCKITMHLIVYSINVLVKIRFQRETFVTEKCGRGQ